MDDIIKNLQEKVNDLKKRNIELEDKIVEIVSRKSYNFHVSTPDKPEAYKLIVNLINSATKEVLIITRGFDIDFTHIIINKWQELNRQLMLITLDRHLIFKSENIKGYDFLTSSNTLEIVNNPDVSSTFIMVDREKFLMLSSDLNKNELNNKFVTAATAEDENITRKFFKFFNEHLPSFMKMS